MHKNIALTACFLFCLLPPFLFAEAISVHYPATVSAPAPEPIPAPASIPAPAPAGGQVQPTQSIDGTESIEGTEGTEAAASPEGAEGTESIEGTENPEGAESIEGTEGSKGTASPEDTEGIEGAFPENRFVDASFLLLVNPITLRMGFNPIPLPPGTPVPKPVYFPSAASPGGKATPPTHRFTLDPEAFFSLAALFRVEKWLSVGLQLGIGYEETPFETFLPADPTDPASPKVPSYYAFELWGGGNALGSIVNDSRGRGKHSNGEEKYFYYPLFYGQVRLEVAPLFRFFPLQNAQTDAKGLYLEAAPFIGLDMNSTSKTEMDALVQNGVRRLEIEDENASVPREMKRLAHESANRERIREALQKAGGDLNPYLRFYGGASVNIGWQGILTNGAALETGLGLGFDSSRGFFLQWKSSMGYCFR